MRYIFIPPRYHALHCCTTHPEQRRTWILVNETTDGQQEGEDPHMCRLHTVPPSATLNATNEQTQTDTYGIGNHKELYALDAAPLPTASSLHVRAAVMA